MDNSYQFTMRKGPRAGAVFMVSGPLVTIGRYQGNTITIQDEQVSRHHARIKQTPEGYVVEDLSSANGLYVNDKQVTTRLLAVGDVVRLGTSVELAFEPASEQAKSIQRMMEGQTAQGFDTSGTLFVKPISDKELMAPRRDDAPSSSPVSQRVILVGALVGILVLAAVIFFLLNSVLTP
jgi:pSer/pThr/pTyr-binding forkhead associated (FHA) protein